MVGNREHDSRSDFETLENNLPEDFYRLVF